MKTTTILLVLCIVAIAPTVAAEDMTFQEQIDDLRVSVEENAAYMGMVDQGVGYMNTLGFMPLQDKVEALELRIEKLEEISDTHTIEILTFKVDTVGSKNTHHFVQSCNDDQVILNSGFVIHGSNKEYLHASTDHALDENTWEWRFSSIIRQPTSSITLQLTCMGMVETNMPDF